MSEISKLLKESQNPQERLMAETRGLVSKWEKTGLLEGISNDTEKSGMSILLENQAKQLIDEASRTGQWRQRRMEWSSTSSRTSVCSQKSHQRNSFPFNQ